MDIPNLGSLAVLALVDSMSFGTLLIPVWLLMAPGRIRLTRILLFLLTVTAVYYVIGLALLLGAGVLVEGLGALRKAEAFAIGQLFLGAALVVISQLMDSKQARAHAAERVASGDGRIARWRKQAMGDGEASARSMIALIVLAVTAVLAEVAMMLPYLAAIGIITAEGPGWPGNGVLLALYCLVMIVPALSLTIGRLLARNSLELPLSKLDRWLMKHAQSTTAWIIGIVGAVLGLRAIIDLGWIGG